MPSSAWRVELGGDAERDLLAVIGWTAERFGTHQARRYRQLIRDAIGVLSDGPEVPGARRRADLGTDVWLLHVGRRGQPGRHFLVYRVLVPRQIDIVRILHDAMDLARHWPASDHA